jgi:hypothetical protein
MDSIVLDTSHGLVELLIAMMELNKYVLDLFLFPTSNLNLRILFSFLFVSLQVGEAGPHKTQPCS